MSPRSGLAGDGLLRLEIPLDRDDERTRPVGEGVLAEGIEQDGSTKVLGRLLEILVDEVDLAAVHQGGKVVLLELQSLGKLVNRVHELIHLLINRTETGVVKGIFVINLHQAVEDAAPRE